MTCGKVGCYIVESHEHQTSSAGPEREMSADVRAEEIVLASRQAQFASAKKFKAFVCLKILSAEQAAYQRGVMDMAEADAEIENARGQWTQCHECKESQPTVDPTNGQCQNGCGEENADRRGVDGNLK